ncbi:MAG: HEAT repeat domain-containing protein, partial [Verrucomicrobiota bacterium]
MFCGIKSGLVAAWLSLPVLLAAQTVGEDAKKAEIAQTKETLENGTLYERSRAIYAVPRLDIKDEATLEKIVNILNDDEQEEIHRAAISTLRKIAPKHPDLIVKGHEWLLTNESWHNREIGFEILRGSGLNLAGDIDALREHLQSDDWRRKRLAATVVDRSNNRNGLVKVYVPAQAPLVPDLAKCLHDEEHPDLRKAAVEALDGLRHHSQPVLPELVSRLKVEPEAEIRIEILRTIDEIDETPDFDGVPILIDLLSEHEGDSVRRTAAKNLQLPWPNRERAIPALFQLIKTDRYAGAAAESLASIDPDGDVIVPKVLKLLESAQLKEHVWEYGVQIFEHLGPAAAPATPRLRELLEHGSPAAQRASAAALTAITGETQDAEIEALARAMLNDGSRSDAIYTLDDSDHPGAVRVLVDALRDQRYQALELFERAAAAGEPEAHLEVARLLMDGPIEIRDSEAAIARMREAAELGSIVACEELGLAYLRGEHIERNVEEAEYWFRMARDRRALQEQSLHPDEGDKFLFMFEMKLSERFDRLLKAHDEQAVIDMGWGDGEFDKVIFAHTQFGEYSDDFVRMNDRGLAILGEVSYSSFGNGSLFPPQAQLKEAELAKVRQLLSSGLPPSVLNVPLQEACLFSFHEKNEQWVTRVYHSKALPNPVREIARLVGHETPQNGQDPNLILEIETFEVPTAGAFLDDGSLVVAMRDRVATWSPTGDVIQDGLDYERQSVNALSQDGLKVFTGYRDATIRRASDFSAQAIMNVEKSWRGAQFSCNGDHIIAYHYQDRRIALINAATGELTAHFLMDSTPGDSMAVTNDGKRAATMG